MNNLSRPNYQNYTDKELNQALATIDSHAYPEHFRDLVSELERRQQGTKAKSSDTPLSDETHPDDKWEEAECIKDYYDPNQAKKDQQKVLRTLGYAAIIIFLGVFSLPAYFNTYLVAQQYYGIFAILTWVTAALVLIVSAYYSLHNKNAVITAKQRSIFGIKTKQGERSFFMFSKCLFVLCCVLLSYFVAARTLPVLAHNYLLDNTRQSIVVTVADKSHSYRRKHCNGRAYIEEFKHAQVDYICSVLSRDTWESLQAGDKLRLFGSQSKVGFLVTGARKEL